MRMIGLCGRAGAGKSFVAKELADMHKNGHVVSFAAQLRYEIEQVMGIGAIPNLWKKPTSPEIRFILQKYGTEYRRAQDDNYWVEKGMAEARNLAQLGRLVIFDDVRFPNEADAIKEQGGFIVRVDTSTNLRRLRLGTLPEEHASETSMDKYDVDWTMSGSKGERHDRDVRNIMVEATVMDIDFLEAIHDSLTHRE